MKRFDSSYKLLEENDSELETVARESIATSVEYVLSWFGIDIDIEDAIGERDW